MIKVAVLGYGTIGSGVVKALDINRDIIARNAGQEIEMKYVLDIRDFPGDPIEKYVVHDFNVILNDPEIRVVVEVMGGEHPAYEYAKAALQAGKHVCTSNKALVAAYGTDLLNTAKANNVNFLFEASVGGGIPILRPLARNLTVDDVGEIVGILNGTTNYILTKMYDSGSSFEDTLKEAQQLGYAERNPEADIEGHDACRKIAILASINYGEFMDYQSIKTTGITKITATDMIYARALGKKVKLLGRTRKEEGNIYAEVCPFMIGPESPLYAVDGVMNAVVVRGNLLGDTMFYGSGAGSLPTASAVVSDVIDMVKHDGKHVELIWEAGPLKLADIGGLKSRYFIRMDSSDHSIRGKVAIESVMVLPELPDEYAVITEEISGTEACALAESESVRSIIKVK